MSRRLAVARRPGLDGARSASAMTGPSALVSAPRVIFARLRGEAGRDSRARSADTFAAALAASTLVRLRSVLAMQVICRGNDGRLLPVQRVLLDMLFDRWCDQSRYRLPDGDAATDLRRRYVGRRRIDEKDQCPAA